MCQMISNVFGKENERFNRNQIELQQRNYLHIETKMKYGFHQKNITIYCM